LLHPGRSPRGGRGLKPERPASGDAGQPSLPSRGAWIETLVEDLV